MAGVLGDRSRSFPRWISSLLSLVLVAVVACSDQGVVTAPGDGPGGAGQTVGAQVPVDSLALEPDSVDLVTWEEVTLQARAFDEDGNEIATFRVDGWEVSEDGVIDLKKRPSEDAAEVTAVSESAATVTVTAHSGDASATAKVVVAPLNDRVVLIDPDVLWLISTPEELEAGTYVFRVDGSPLPDLEAGDIISGEQDPTFLRRVVSVQQGSEFVLQTAEAKLREVFRKGAKAYGRVDRIRAGPKDRKRVEKGPGEKPNKGKKGFDYEDPRDAQSQMVQAASDDIFGLPDGLDLCATGDADWGGEVGVCADVAVTGSVDATFDVDVDVKVSLLDPEFDLDVEGEVDFLLDYEASLTVEGSVTLEQVFWTPWVRVTILGIPGRLRVGTAPGLEVSASGEVTILHGFDGHLWAMAGVSYDDDHWDFVSGWDKSFNWHDPSYEVSADAGLRIYFEKRAELRWAGTRTTVRRGPFGKITVTATGEHPVHDGTLMPPPLHANATVGYQVGLKAEVEALDIASYSKAVDLYSVSVFDWWGQGRTRVQVSTTGVDPDPSGYTVRLVREEPAEDPEWSRTSTRTTGGPDGSVLFERDPAGRSCMRLFEGSWRNCDLANEWHLLELDDVMWNCEVQGGTPQRVHLHPFTTVDETATVACVSVFESLGGTIDEMVADGRIVRAGVGQALKKHLENGDAARMRGSSGAAYRILDAFVHLVEAQSKSGMSRGNPGIEAGAAELLSERARQIQAGYLDG